MTRSIWKGPFVNNKSINDIRNGNKNLNKPIKLWAKNIIIFPTFVGLVFEVYNGKRFVQLLVKKQMIGFRFGEFIFTKKSAKHK